MFYRRTIDAVARNKVITYLDAPPTAAQWKSRTVEYSYQCADIRALARQAEVSLKELGISMSEYVNAVLEVMLSENSA